MGFAVSDAGALILDSQQKREDPGDSLTGVEENGAEREGASNGLRNIFINSCLQTPQNGCVWSGPSPSQMYCEVLQRVMVNTMIAELNNK